ncbi:MAG: metallophosphoesterase [Planctomycetes bacterium]|nr:metallophosphoesterase [Planctomycetota bacterium]
MILRPLRALAGVSGLVVLAFGARAQSTAPHAAAVPQAPAPQDVRFAVIGDYGVDTPSAAAVAQLVDALGAQFVVTLGDNNYTAGEQATIDAHIGQHYSQWIFPYVGTYPSVARKNRFFPTLGNHDWGTPGAVPYLNYFTLPGNERYYDVRKGPVHFFCVDSDAHEPDGITASSPQAQWLQAALAASNAPFKFVYFHHPPYSSAVHGNTWDLQWPFRAWGADAVLAGHDHDYERFVHDGFPTSSAVSAATRRTTSGRCSSAGARRASTRSSARCSSKRTRRSARFASSTSSARRSTNARSGARRSTNPRPRSFRRVLRGASRTTVRTRARRGAPRGSTTRRGPAARRSSATATATRRRRSPAARRRTTSSRATSARRSRSRTRRTSAACASSSSATTAPPCS